jgi:nicotinamidase-related amidase
MAKFQELERGTLIVAGIEAHICVLQTALDALAEGYQVHVVADAVGSRDEANKRLALKRLAKAGAVITCVESVLFEWMIRCDVSEFKDIQRLVK